MSSVLNSQSSAQTAKPRPDWISYEQFLESTDGEHVEWVDGKVVPMAPISNEHSDVAGFLLTLMRIWTEHKKLGVVRFEPMQMKTGKDLPGRSPDVLFLSNER